MSEEQDLTAVVHQDATQDHLSAQADESVVKAAQERREAQQEEYYDYAAAAAEVAEEPSETKPTEAFGSPDHQPSLPDERFGAPDREVER